jgi:hypothetical protein
MATDPNMGFTLPVVGASGDVWGQILLDALEDIGAHDHSTGSGVPVKPSGLRINADLPMAYNGTQYALTTVKAIDFTPAAPADVSSYLHAVFASSTDGNLYYRNGSSTNVKITDGNTLNFTVGGAIGGDYVSADALLAYVESDNAYTFKKTGSPRPWSDIRAGNIDIYETATTASTRVRMASPSALASSYVVTWPAAVPAGKRLVQSSSAGTLTFENTGVTSITMAADADVTVSGTGDFPHGDRKINQAGDGVTASGTLSPAVASNVVYYGLTALGVVHIPLRGLRNGDRVKAVRVNGISANEPAIAVYIQSENNAASTATTASGGPITSTGNITHTLDTPETIINDFNMVWVRITAGAGAINIYGITTTFDRP